MRRGSGGFTIIEAMIVLTIMGVLVMVAIPSFNYLTANTKVKNASTELYLALIRARAEAVKRNRVVSVSAKSGDWDNGWEVLVDGNGDGDYDDLAGADRRVVDQGAFANVAITMGANSVVFRSSGRISGVAPMFEVGSRDAKFPLKRCVSADVTGRAYIKKEACA